MENYDFFAELERMENDPDYVFDFPDFEIPEEDVATDQEENTSGAEEPSEQEQSEQQQAEQSTSKQPQPATDASSSDSLRCSIPSCTCGNRTFPRRSALKKHLDRKTRPYVCNEPDCRGPVKNFTTKHDLQRHQREKHGETGNIPCPVPTCKRAAPGKGFTRNDNLVSHLRNMHPDVTVTGGFYFADAQQEDPHRALQQPGPDRRSGPGPPWKLIVDTGLAPYASAATAATPPDSAVFSFASASSPSIPSPVGVWTPTSSAAAGSPAALALLREIGDEREELKRKMRELEAREKWVREAMEVRVGN